jgi:hypothetical protein
MSRVTAFASVIPARHCVIPPFPPLSFPRMRESSLVLVVCPLFCRCQGSQDNEVLLVGGLADKDDG